MASRIACFEIFHFALDTGYDGRGDMSVDVDRGNRRNLNVLQLFLCDLQLHLVRCNLRLNALVKIGRQSHRERDWRGSRMGVGAHVIFLRSAWRPDGRAPLPA